MEAMKGFLEQMWCIKNREKNMLEAAGLFFSFARVLITRPDSPSDYLYNQVQVYMAWPAHGTESTKHLATTSTSTAKGNSKLPLPSFINP